MSRATKWVDVRGESDGVATKLTGVLEHPVVLVGSPRVAQDSVAGRNACTSFVFGTFARCGLKLPETGSIFPGYQPTYSKG